MAELTILLNAQKLEMGRLLVFPRHDEFTFSAAFLEMSHLDTDSGDWS
jgi:hypothetical protein